MALSAMDMNVIGDRGPCCICQRPGVLVRLFGQEVYCCTRHLREAGRLVHAGQPVPA